MRTALQANKMVIVFASMATPNGLKFTVGQITWTTGSDNFIAMTTEEVQIPSASTTTSPASAMALTMTGTAPTTMDLAPTMVHLAPTTPASSSATPTTHRPLPHYKGKQIDNTDLFDSIDRVGTKLAETLALVSTIQSQPNEQVTAPHNRSTRPAQTSRLARLGTDLVVISTPEGRSARRRLASATGLWLFEYEASMENYQAQPYGL